jgi:hypothetical protein
MHRQTLIPSAKHVCIVALTSSPSEEWEYKMGSPEGEKEVGERSIARTFRRIRIKNSIITSVSFLIHLEAMDFLQI